MLNRKWAGVVGVVVCLVLAVAVYIGTMPQLEPKLTPVIEVHADRTEVSLDDPTFSVTGTLKNVTNPSAYQLICEQNIDGEVGWVADATPITVGANGSFASQVNVGYSGTFVDVRFKCVVSDSTIYSETLRIAIFVNPGE
jgi:hypothetical protein